MVVLNHAVVLLASLAALAAASPASTQWSKPDASATVVAHHGKPNDVVANGDGKVQEQGNWQHSAAGNDEEEENKSPSEKGKDGGKKNYHQARDEGAPPEHRTFAEHKGGDPSKGKPSGKDREDENDKHHKVRDEDAPSGHPTFAKLNGDDSSKDKSSGKDREHGTYKQHHARTEDVLATLRRLARQEDTVDKQPQDADHDHHGHSHDQKMEHESHNHTETGEHGKGKLHEGRAASQKGVYECANANWLHPCVWTPLKDGQCYNRLYGRYGSMGPDNGLSCTIYEAPDCNDHGWNTCGPFVWPGIADYQKSHLLLYYGMADDGPFSIKCKGGPGSDCVEEMLPWTHSNNLSSDG
ncbi:uncharacterized protein Z519_11483 [Cladophialophora bantiana CBS 173.52]|uniref:Secreted protein n=1 Tax=Cladophialophora bantiana (strain ATCC 10958 / CBS 173.52 / CDC B-1940 / NIH 8579) TaxID=1442370 RepID=A0A0D2HTV5_CLAB1|nr:uncharacterized protein Z519_11483 [Cladophialophora bantiana CBS 173.52]KIW87899.1 hypothetical protein Z519_11483 [Cladophialophora bantiana CBS 173.52]